MPITEVETIWMDGELVPWHEAKVHVLSHALHYGCGVFEGIRAYATVARPRGVAPRRAPRPHVRVRRASTTWRSRTRRTS